MINFFKVYVKNKPFTVVCTTTTGLVVDFVADVDITGFVVTTSVFVFSVTTTGSVKV